jgi:arginine deiminase
VRPLAARIRAEFDRLRRVAIHRPGIEMFFGLLAPDASLYERAFNRYGARREHERLEYILKHEFGIEVFRIKEKLLELADKKPEVRDKLVSAGLSHLKFTGNELAVSEAVKQAQEGSKMYDSGHFFNLLLLHPALDLEKEGRAARAIHLGVTESDPLANLYFMRDQQAVTDKGIYLSRMSKPQRGGEPSLTRFVWETLGEQIVHETRSPGTFEGGDFIPMKDFALVGFGDRTNRSGVDQMLEFGLNFDEVAVVHQPSHPLIPGDEIDPMIDMHVDTYFNVAGSGVAIGSELLLKRARVEVYNREGQNVYKKSEIETDLHNYIKKKGFDVINLTTLEQLCYASNFLCIKDGQILAIEVEREVKNVLETLATKAKENPHRYGKLLDQARKDYQDLQDSGGIFPHKKEIYHHGIDAYAIVMTNLTGGYGGAHCMTAALERN